MSPGEGEQPTEQRLAGGRKIKCSMVVRRIERVKDSEQAGASGLEEQRRTMLLLMRAQIEERLQWRTHVEDS